MNGILYYLYQIAVQVKLSQIIMSNQKLQQGEQEIVVFRFKRGPSEIEPDTIKFIEQPAKIRKIADKFIRNPSELSKKSELFLKKCEPNGLPICKENLGKSMVSKQQQISTENRSATRKQLIKGLRQGNTNNITIIDIGRQEEAHQQKQIDIQEDDEEENDIFYLLQTRQKVGQSNEKATAFPEELRRYIDSDEEEGQSFSNSDVDSEYEQMSCEIAPQQSWKQTVNGQEVEYMDQYSTFSARVKSKRHNMS